MPELSSEVDVENGEYRFQGQTDEAGMSVYDAVPFSGDHQLIWYPASEVEDATDHEIWFKFLTAVAGDEDELKVEIYVNYVDINNMEIIRFTDPETTFAVIANRAGVEDFVVQILGSTEWRLAETSGLLKDSLSENLFGSLVPLDYHTT